MVGNRSGQEAGSGGARSTQGLGVLRGPGVGQQAVDLLPPVLEVARERRPAALRVAERAPERALRRRSRDHRLDPGGELVEQRPGLLRAERLALRGAEAEILRLALDEVE